MVARNGTGTHVSIALYSPNVAYRWTRHARIIEAEKLYRTWTNEELVRNEQAPKEGWHCKTAKSYRAIGEIYDEMQIIRDRILPTCLPVSRIVDCWEYAQGLGVGDHRGASVYLNHPPTLI
jgi:hypothetical protein